MILADAVGDLLQQNRLAGARRSDDQHALTHADRRDQIDDAHVHVFRIGFEHDAAIRMQRREVFEIAGVGDALGVFAVDGFDAKQRKVSFGFLRRTNLALNDVAIAQAETADLARAECRCHPGRADSCIPG